MRNRVNEAGFDTRGGPPGSLWGALRLLHLLGALALAVLLGSAADAQIISVEFRDEKAAKKFKKHLQVLDGRTVIIGEPKAGIKCSPGNVQYSGGSDAKNELWVGDSARPDKVPYREVRGERKKASGGTVISFAGQDVARMAYVDALQTLEGLATEYAIRDGELESLEEQRDDLDKSSREWVDTHARLVAGKERMVSWLRNMGYSGAVKKLEKDIDKDRRAVAKSASEARQKAAIVSIEPADPPEDFLAAVEECGGADFKLMESQHFRFFYEERVPDDEIYGALELAETLVEGFRRDFVDPYLGDDFADRIPDGPFMEWCLVPPTPSVHERLLETWYGQSWGQGENRERSLKSGNKRLMRSKAPHYVAYFRINERRDTQGMVAHTLGHSLADLHYNHGRRNAPQPWLEEAVGYYLSFGYLGRNSVTCFSFSKPTYAQKKKKEGEKTVELGMRGYFNELALSFGPPLEQLSRKQLAEIVDADFAKAWSFFDYVGKELGKEGQQWLRETCQAARVQSSFAKNWRAASEKAFGVEPGTDVFRVIEERWKTYASTVQARQGDRP